MSAAAVYRACSRNIRGPYAGVPQIAALRFDDQATQIRNMAITLRYNRWLRPACEIRLIAGLCVIGPLLSAPR
jgi:hypothetical protein